MVTDASQARQWDVASDPWGNALPLSTGTIAQDLRLPGQQMQAESGLFQNWHRDYDPTLGRHIEADPIGLAGGGNPFAYASGNPLNLIDPLGLQATYEHSGDDDNGHDTCDFERQQELKYCKRQFSYNIEALGRCYRKADENYDMCRRGLRGRWWSDADEDGISHLLPRPPKRKRRWR
jgi:RHS repeat-associated protein